MPLNLTLSSFRQFSADDLFLRLSTGSGGTQGDKGSFLPKFSANGRYVLFSSDATNLVAGDGNSHTDTFRKDLFTGETIRVSTSSNGVEGDGDSYGTDISSDGRYVIFESEARNFVEGDTNVIRDVFRKDLLTGEIIRVSIAPDGSEASRTYNGQMSGDGRYVIFESESKFLVAGDNNNETDVFLKDLVTGGVLRVSTSSDGSEANGSTIVPRITADGRYVVFMSYASNLVENDSNGAADIFRKDIVTGEMVRVSVTADGTEADSNAQYPQITPDGRYVVFASRASNLVAGDEVGTWDVFRKDLVTGEIVRASTAADGTQANGGSSSAQISADGRFVLFHSSASNLVPGDNNGVSDAFRKDLLTGEVARLSTRADGTELNAGSSFPVYSADGSYVVFESSASNLIAGDTNGVKDIFAPNWVLRPHQQAVLEGRYVQASFATGTASHVRITWGDGTVDAQETVNGNATFSHAYAKGGGTYSATVAVSQYGQTWIVPHLVDLGAGHMARDTGLADTLTGGEGVDSLVGDAFANAIFGRAGNDRLTGEAGHDGLMGEVGRDNLSGGVGDDRLFGGAGRDVLNGGSGKDVFAFDTKITKKTFKAHRDKIVGYKAKDDAIWLDNKVFKKLGKKGSEKKPAKLKKAFFSLKKAEDKNDYIVFNAKKKALYYDADGSGKGAALQIATFDKKLKLSHAEFFVI